jgi:hypothetical protein
MVHILHAWKVILIVKDFQYDDHDLLGCDAVRTNILEEEVDHDCSKLTASFILVFWLAYPLDPQDGDDIFL